MMIISVIAAMAENRVIGCDNAIPWDLPADRKRFRALTLGHPVIMGRKTFESLAGPLPGRKNIIITRQQDYQAQGCSVAHNLAAALALAGETDEVFICGGGEVYQEALPIADRIYLTIIHEEFDGDRHFPEIPGQFVEVERKTVSDEVAYSFLLFIKRET
jgi:dihydrofolate reductase